MKGTMTKVVWSGVQPAIVELRKHSRVGRLLVLICGPIFLFIALAALANLP